ncbi:MAG TPA: FG-GAP-like repeat-containing protein [Candidatus Polarisedimenticolia bacterium]|nr:FG-GAP-like repeat-containing protein [Candidatus Polarisedimenticolia bacterium]
MPRTSFAIPAGAFWLCALLLIMAGLVLGAGASPVMSAEPGRAPFQVFNTCEIFEELAPGPRRDIFPESPMSPPVFEAITTPASPALPASTPSWVYQPNQAWAQAGWSLGAGDMNGDGVADLAVGAPGFINGEHDEGAVLVFAGSPAGLEPAPRWTLEGNLADVRFGSDTGIVRDINGDGLKDLLMGSLYYSNDQDEEGVAAMWRGTSLGPPCRPSWVIEGNEADGYFGYTVNSAGDVNGDGFGDVMVGWAEKEAGLYSPGRAFVYNGGPNGLGSMPNWSAVGTAGSNEFLGAAAAAGDVNGDGFGDLLVGAPYYDNGQLDEGAAFLYLGSPTGLSATPVWSAEANETITYFGVSLASGDVNGDGYSDMMIVAYEYDFAQTNDGAVFIYHGSSSGLPSSPNLVLHGNAPGFELGSGVKVGNTMATGDVNGDGFDDLLVATAQFSNGQIHEGAVFLYLGSPAGLSSTPSWMAEGNQSASQFGNDVALADLNADGLDDVIVGAWSYSGGQTEEGSVFVYLTQGPAAPAAGRVSEEDPLVLQALPNGALELSWGSSCAPGDSDFEVYEGILGDFGSHLPRACSTGGLMSYQLMPSAGDRYYLVVPRNGLREGSYGLRSDGTERPVSASACMPQSIASSCPLSP